MASWRSMTKRAGSGSASGSTSQWRGSADPDPDPDPHQNVIDTQHCPESSPYHPPPLKPFPCSVFPFSQEQNLLLPFRLFPSLEIPRRGGGDRWKGGGKERGVDLTRTRNTRVRVRTGAVVASPFCPGWQPDRAETWRNYPDNCGWLCSGASHRSAVVPPPHPLLLQSSSVVTSPRG